MSATSFAELNQMAKTHLKQKGEAIVSEQRKVAWREKNTSMERFYKDKDGDSCSDLTKYVISRCLFLVGIVTGILSLFFAEKLWVQIAWFTPLIIGSILDVVFQIRDTKSLLDVKLGNLPETQAVFLRPLIGFSKERISLYLSDKIATLRDELIGDRSQLTRISKRLKDVDHRARSVRAQLNKRCGDDENPPEYLTATLTRVEDTCERIASKQEVLSEYTARIEAFLAECRTAAKQVERPLADLELVREANMLCEEAESLEQVASRVVAETTSKLVGRMIEAKSEVKAQLEGAGVELALESAATNDALRDFRILETTISRFVPADKLLEGVAS